MAQLTEESVEKLTKAINNLNDKVSDTTDNYEDLGKKGEKALKGIQDETKKEHKILGGLYNLLDKTVDSTESLIGIVTGGGLLLSLTQMARNSWELSNNMHTLSVRMGNGVKGAKELRDSVTGMMKATGASYENAKFFVSTLAENKYVGNIQEAAQAMDLFSRASGVSTSTASQFGISLTKQAGLATKSVTAIMAGMVGVQQKVGITQQGMEALSSTIIDISANMAAFGKGADEIKLMAQNTTALVGELEKVGISAQNASQLIEKMTNPDNIEDNIMLYSQMGISLQDAMEGNIELNDEAMKDMAQRIKDMGAIAGSQFARSMGLSYKEISRIAEMDTGSLSQTTQVSDDKAMDELHKAEEVTEGITDKILTVSRKIQGMIMGFGPLLVTAVNFAIPKILKAFKNMVGKMSGVDSADNMQASVATSVSKGGEEGLEIFKKSFSDKMKEATDAIKQNYQREVADTNRKVFASILKQYDNLKGGGMKLGLKLGEDGRFNEGEGANGDLTASQKKNAARANKEIERLITAYQKLTGNSEDAANSMEQQARNIKMSEKAEALINKYKNSSAALEEEITGLQKKQALIGKSNTKARNEINKKLEEARRKYILQQDIIDKATKSLSKYNKNIEDASDSVEEISKKSIFGRIKDGLLGRLGVLKERGLDKLGQIGGAEGIGAAARSGHVAIGAAKLVGGATLKGIGVALKGIGKFLGPMAMGMMVLTPLMKAIQPQIESLTKNVGEKLQPFFQAVTDSLGPLLNTLVKSIGPILLKLLAKVIEVVGFLLTPIKWLFQWLSKFKLGGLGKAFGGMATAMEELTGPKVTGALVNAADSLSKSNEDLTKSTDENTDAVENKPAEITIEGGKAKLVSEASVQTVGSPAGSVTQQVEEKESAKKELEKETQKKNDKAGLNIAQSSNELLGNIYSVLDAISSKLTSLSENNQISWGKNISLDGSID